MPVTELAGFLMRRPASAGGAYSIARSLRFNSADSAYLNFTPGASNRDAWTLWLPLKRAGLGITATLLSADSTSDDRIYFNSSDQLCIDIAGTTRLVSTQVFRDPAAWGTLRVVYDAANGTAANRLRVFNGPNEITAWGTDTRSGISTGTAKIGHTVVHNIGRRLNGTTNYFDGYLVDVAFKASADTSWCGQTDATTGQFLPTQPTGATWWLPFSDNSGTTSTTLGKDGAGSNNWTPNNFSVTAGVGNDSLTDTPTNNYCTLLNTVQGGGFGGANTFTNGNLDVVTNAGAISAGLATWGITSGKWYWEVLINSATGSPQVGICPQQIGTISTNGLGQDATSYAYSSGGSKGNSNSFTAYGSSYTSADVISVAYDADNGKLFFAKNGTWQNSGDPAAGTNAAFTSLSGTYFPAFSDAGGANTVSLSFNFGQRAFSYTPPSGFSALCTSNLPTPSIVKPNAQFDVETFTGTGATRSKTGLAFQPDLVWFKGRSGATDHALYDSIRGVQKQLESNQAGAATTETTGLTAFNSDGYTTGSLAQLNTNAATYAAWLWKKGVTPGFDIVSYTGNGSAGRAINHSLGVAPALMIAKNRTTAAREWIVWHRGLTGSAYYLLLGGTAAQANTWSEFQGSSSTTFTVGNDNYINANGDSYIAYLFAEVAGFSRFGSYTGNGSADGPFVHCGFRPRWVMVKRTDSTGDWYIWDTARDTINPAVAELLANSTATEAGTADLDPLSNGFKLRATTAGFNASGGTYIFAAFAEFPFKYANAR